MSEIITIRTLGIGSANTIAQNATVYSESMSFWRCTGYSGAKITTSAGSITVSQQCSLDGDSWYDPVDRLNLSLGNVATAMSVGTRYVQFAPVLGQFIRFKFVELNVASTSVGMELFFQENP